MLPGFAESRTGTPIMRVRPAVGCRTSVIISFSMTWGWLKTSSRLTTGAHGTSAAWSSRSHSSRGLVSKTPARMGKRSLL